MLAKKYITLLITTAFMGCSTNTNLPSKSESKPLLIQQVKKDNVTSKPNEFVFCDEKGAWKCKKKTKLNKLNDKEIKRQKRDFNLEKSEGTQGGFMDDYYKSTTKPKYTINFDFDKDELLPLAIKQLNQLVVDQETEKPVHFILHGYTDNVGTKPYNNKLAERRAARVKQHLTKKGIIDQNITLNSEGKCCYINVNTTENGKAKNRRVEIYIKSTNQ